MEGKRKEGWREDLGKAEMGIYLVNEAMRVPAAGAAAAVLAAAGAGAVLDEAAFIWS